MASENTAMRALAWIELNMLNSAEVLPLEGAVMRGEPTDVYDVNGELLFERIPLDLPQGGAAFADVAADPRLGAPLIAVGISEKWDERGLLDRAAAAFDKRFPGTRFDNARFVAFSFPKLAVQFLSDGREIALLELFTWEPVPPALPRPDDGPPTNFERWSFLEELDPSDAHTRRVRFTERKTELEPLIARLEAERFSSIEKRLLEPRDDSPQPMPRGHGRRRRTATARRHDVRPCCELIGQQTPVWCVPASVQMLLGFHNYCYKQTLLAHELGQGTVNRPGSLPDTQEDDVRRLLDALTSNAFIATLEPFPKWSVFCNEIHENRPLISGITGHARTIAGYTISNVRALPTRGLIVYDPAPPVIVWENFDVPTHIRAYTCKPRPRMPRP